MYKNKWIKYTLFTLIIIAFSGFLLSLYIKKNALEKITDIPGIACENVAFNPFSGCLELEQLSIQRPIGEKESEVLDLITTKVKIHGLSYWQYLKNDKVFVNEVLFADLAIKVKANKEEMTVERDSQAKRNTPEEILVKKIRIENGQLAVQNEQFKQLQLDTFSTNIDNFQFLIKKDSQQINWSKFEFLSKQFLLNEQKSDNRLLASSIELTANNKLSIQDFRWQPKYSKSNYLDHHPYRKARLDVKIPSVEVFQFSLHDLLFKKSLKAQSIVAKDGALKIYTDKNKVACPDCLKTYHYEDFIDSELKIGIDSIQIKNSLIVLEELGAGKQKAGKLDWSKVYASIYNLTNHPAEALTKPTTVADIQAIFVDDGQVDLHFEFPNFDKNADYRFYGNLDRVKLKDINSFLVFSKRFRIKQGVVSKFAFNGRGNLQGASGEMKLRYKDLALQLLNKDRSPRKFLSKIANTLIGNKNNPNKDEKLRKGIMYFERDLQKSFISNWWRTMQTGIKSTMLPNILLPKELEHKTK
ncbi:MAG: hypothetical protein AB8G86_00395 [Saprospiraceae bacterium]